MPSAGTRVRVVDNERLDIPDFQAIFSLIYGWNQAAEGMIAGVNEGCLSPPAVTYEEVGPVRQIRLGNATLYGAQNDATSSNLTTAYPVVYDPTDPNQLQSTLDLSAYANAGGAIWWTVDLVNSDLDNRRVWESGYPDGRAVAMLTRQRQRVRFAATADFNTSPTPGTWFRMGAFWLPTSGAPTVLWLHAYDFGGQNDMAPLIAAGTDPATRVRIGQWIFRDGYNPASNSGRSFGIGRYAAQFGMVALSTLDSGWEYDPETLEITSAGTVGFETPPTRGLYQINAALDAINGFGQPVAIFTVRFQGGAYVIANAECPDFAYSISDGAFGSGHKATITLINAPVGEKIVGFSVQPIAGFGFTSSDTPYIAMVAPDQTLPFTGDGATDMQIEVALMYKNTGTYGGYTVVDGSFTLVVYGTRP